MKEKNKFNLCNAHLSKNVIQNTFDKEFVIDKDSNQYHHSQTMPVPGILFVTSYPPRECGIATYSQDLIHAIDNKFGRSFSIKVCALETKDETCTYDEKVVYTFDTTNSAAYMEMADRINQDETVNIVVIQHEFGFFQLYQGKEFQQFLLRLSKPVILGFHTVLPRPGEVF